MINLYDFPRLALIELFASWGYSAYHAEKLFRSLYQDGVHDLNGLEGLRPDLTKKLLAETSLPELDVRLETHSQDGFTRKYLLGLADGKAIETVIMQFTGRYTACISTQVGCAMGCVFCATGQMGFTRHLTPGEIVGQIRFVRQVLAQDGQDLRNIVLMGMGEPLHNYDNTMAAIDILTDHAGMSLGPRHITLSTVGIVPGIRRLADEKRLVHLAVSLHGATDAERQALVPPAKRWPLAELIDACRYYTEKRKRRIFFEWTLIAGENDTPEQAHAVGRLLTGLDAHVNLIPLNPTTGYNGIPSDPQAVRTFQDTLASYGLPSTVRQRRGIDVAAGCGQLALTP